MEKYECKDCIYFTVKDNRDGQRVGINMNEAVTGECYLNPPTVFFDRNISYARFIRPHVSELDFCSHFRSEFK